MDVYHHHLSLGSVIWSNHFCFFTCPYTRDISFLCLYQVQLIFDSFIFDAVYLSPGFIFYFSLIYHRIYRKQYPWPDSLTNCCERTLNFWRSRFQNHWTNRQSAENDDLDLEIGPQPCDLDLNDINFKINESENETKKLSEKDSTSTIAKETNQLDEHCEDIIRVDDDPAEEKL